ncbi:MAG: aldo/keto reductase [Bacteroidales bacterium]
MNKIKLTENLELSRIIHGHWRLLNWGITDQELLSLCMQCIESGVTSFDHADIYGKFSCEKLFGNALSIKKDIRAQIQIITKCGIQPISDKIPFRKIGYYNYSYEHIISSVDNSLNNFRTDYIDLLLLHRPSPFLNPEEVARAFSKLKQSGKVLEFGVSNFLPQQYEMLNSYLDDKLVTNQLEISPFCLDHFENGNIDFSLQQKIKPMAWSPLAGGELLQPKTEKGQRILKCLHEVALELNINNIDTVIFAWLLKHPASIVPITGSGKIKHIKNAVEALNIDMSIEQWFKIYIASVGKALP